MRILKIQMNPVHILVTLKVVKILSLKLVLRLVYLKSMLCTWDDLIEYKSYTCMYDMMPLISQYITDKENKR